MTSCASSAPLPSFGRRSSRCKCRSRRRTRSSLKSASSALLSYVSSLLPSIIGADHRARRSWTSLCPSAGRPPSRGGGRARSALSAQSSACSRDGRRKSSSGGGSTFTRCGFHRGVCDWRGMTHCMLQLFENQSVVEYWENFANHAFENTTQSVYSHCVLLKPSGTPVPCTFCFSIRRDIMDLPSLVIGKVCYTLSSSKTDVL